VVSVQLHMGLLGVEMFERFFAMFPPAAGEVVGTPRTPWTGDPILGWDELVVPYAGCSFGNGVYRLLDEDLGHRADAAVVSAFPQLRGRRILCFGYDWVGCILALSDVRTADDEPMVVSFDLAIGSIVGTGIGFRELHDEEFVENPNGALSTEAFADWTRRHPEVLTFGRTRCVGHRIPLFLGGRDDEENEEVVEVEIHWTINAQLCAQVGPG
jgi:hypothetical protein